MNLKNNAKMTVSRLVSLVMCIIAGLATTLQVVSFATHTWGAWTDKISGRSVYIGLWYSVVCDGPSGYCASISHHQEHMNNLAKNLTFKEVQYALRVGNQTVVTFAILFSFIGLILSILGVRKNLNKRYNFGAVISLFISGCFMLTVVGYTAGELRAHILYADTTGRNSYHFPWAILLAGLGGCLSLIVAIVKMVLFCFELTPVKSDEERERDDNVYIPMTQNAPPEYSAAMAARPASTSSSVLYNKFSPPSNESKQCDEEYPPLDGNKPELINDCDQNDLNDLNVKLV